MVNPGDKIKMRDEKQRYTVQACNERFAIMTKPFNAKKTYLYTISDLEEGIRGPCNLIFGLPCDVNTPDAAAEALAMLISGEMNVSCTRRRGVELNPCEIAQLKEQPHDR